MSKQRMIVVTVVCLSLTVLAAQGPSRTLPKTPPSKPPGTAGEKRKAIVERHAQLRQQKLRKGEEFMRVMSRQAWKRLLMVSERQWKPIEHKYQVELALDREARVHAPGWVGSENFRWRRRSELGQGTSAKAPEEMTEGERIVEELTDLLEHEDSKGEEIRKKTDALQRVRDKARAALPKARRELAAVLTSPRQEAVFLLVGCID